MSTMRDNATRVKRFRELKATFRTNRQAPPGRARRRPGKSMWCRCGLAHTRIVGPPLTIPNSTRGFTQLWTPHPASAARDRLRRGRLWPRAHRDLP